MLNPALAPFGGFDKKSSLQLEDWNHNRIITIDLECRTINNVMTPYAVGIYDGTIFTSFYLADFKDIEEMITAAVNYLIQVEFHKKYVYLHNFSGFDSHFLLKYLLALSSANILYPTIRGDKLISLTVPFKVGKEVIEITFLDSLNLLPHSLAKLGVAFGVEVQKGIFPYELVNNPNINLNYIGPVPGFNMFNKVSENVYNDYSNGFVDDWNLKSETLKYLEGDCVSLYQILTSFGNLIFSNYKTDITTTHTLPSLSLKIYRNIFMSTKNIPIINGTLYNTLSQAFYGGIVDIYLPYGEDLHYYDVNSLYPFAMKKPIPVGSPVYTNISDEINLDTFFGFIRAKIVCPHDLHIPVLPVKNNGGRDYCVPSYGILGRVVFFGRIKKRTR